MGWPVGWSAVAALHLLAFLATSAGAGAAFAHAAVVSTDPVDGVLLDAAPTAVTIVFNEPVSPVRLQVVDATGSDVTAPDAVSLDGLAVRIALPDDLEPGSYIASYRVVSIDSHPIAGSIVFSVGFVSSRVDASAVTADDTGWRIAMAAARALLFAGVLGGAGGTLFVALIARGSTSEPRIRSAVAVIAAGGAMAALLAIGAQGGLLLNAPASGVLAGATWASGFSSHYARTATAALAGLALVAIGLLAGPTLRPAAWLGAGLALASFGLSGHVVTSGPRWATAPTLIAHTSAAAFWAGSLIPLRRVLRDGDPAAAAIVRRFSRAALPAVGILFVAGMVIAAFQVRSPAALLTTGYGLALTLKLLFVSGLIAIAAYNKLRLTPRLVRRVPEAGRALERTIAAEITLVAAILLTTGVLGTRPPPRVMAAVGVAHAAHPAAVGLEPGLALTIVQDRRSAEIWLGSAWSGVNRAAIRLLDADGTPLDVREVMLIASNPGAGVEPIRREAEPTAEGAWQVDDLLLAPAGRWTLQLDVLINDFEKAWLETRTDLFDRQQTNAGP